MKRWRELRDDLVQCRVERLDRIAPNEERKVEGGVLAERLGDDDVLGERGESRQHSLAVTSTPVGESLGDGLAERDTRFQRRRTPIRSLQGRERSRHFREDRLLVCPLEGQLACVAVTLEQVLDVRQGEKLARGLLVVENDTEPRGKHDASLVELLDGVSVSEKVPPARADGRLLEIRDDRRPPVMLDEEQPPLGETRR